MSAATSSSDRYEAARAARQAWLDTPNDPDSIEVSARRLYRALGALITPAATEETPAEIASRILGADHPLGGHVSIHADDLVSAVRAAVHAGIQAAWNSWEPADVPHAEFMLKNLRIDYRYGADDEGIPSYYIPSQYIEREV